MYKSSSNGKDWVKIKIVVDEDRKEYSIEDWINLKMVELIPNMLWYSVNQRNCIYFIRRFEE